MTVAGKYTMTKDMEYILKQSVIPKILEMRKQMNPAEDPEYRAALLADGHTEEEIERWNCESEG